MPDSPSASTRSGSPFYRVLAEYWEAIESGRVQDQAGWLALHPEFQTELSEFFAVWNGMHSEAESRRCDETGWEAIHFSTLPDIVTDTVCVGPEPSATGHWAVAMGEFGQYTLLGELGRGGMGVVYTARQHQPERIVALKMLRPGHPASAADLRRFREEAEAVARLDDPHIVPIYDMGQHEGVCFYTMKLLTGGNLAAHLSQFALNCRDVATLLVPVARAVHHAHCRGVLHRDLKPSNIILDASRRPHVADFGLARRLEAGLDLTRTGELIGTPSYMAPEQTLGGKADLTVATDVYGLGAVLYTLLTGSPPARGETMIETLRQIQEEEPQPPRSLNLSVDADLETICLKALKKRPQQRYDSALAMAEDLERYLAGEPILARPANLLERSQLWLRRNPRIAAFASTILAVTLLLIAGLSMHNAHLRQVNEQLDESLILTRDFHREAVAEKLRAERSEAEAKILLYVSDISLAAEAQRDGDMGQLHDLLVRHVPQPGTPDHRGFEWHYLWRLGEVGRQDIVSQGEAVYFTEYSPDGRWLATAGQAAVVRLYNARTFQEESSLVTGQIEVNGLAFSPDSRLLATAGNDGTLRLWELSTGGQVLSIAAHVRQAFQVLFVPDSDWLISCGDDAVIRLWDRNTGQSLGELQGHEKPVEAIALSPDGTTLASASSDLTARLWDLPSRSQRQTLIRHEGRVVGVAFSPDGGQLATTSLDKAVRVSSVATGNLLFSDSHIDAFQSLSFSPDGRELAAGDRGGTISLWRKAGQDWSQKVDQVGRWHAHDGRIYSIRFCPNGHNLISSSEDGSVTAWGRPTGESRRMLESETPVRDMAWVGDGNWLTIVDQSGLQVLDVATGQTVVRFATEQPCQAVAATADGRQLAAVDTHGQIRLWDMDSRAQVATWDVGMPPEVNFRLAFSPDGTLLALSSFSKNRFWLMETTTGRIRFQFSAIDCSAPVFSTDGRQLAIPAQNDVLIWDVEQDKFMRPLQGHDSTVKSVAYSPDGNHIATASNDRLVKLWDAATGIERFSLGGNRAEVQSVAFSADSRSLVSGSQQTLRIWHVDTGRPLYHLDTGLSPLEKLLFSPNGRCLASLISGQESAVVLYDTGSVKK